MQMFVSLILFLYLFSIIPYLNELSAGVTRALLMSCKQYQLLITCGFVSYEFR